jgi:O-antigen/teichoic acid export membrane protein
MRKKRLGQFVKGTTITFVSRVLFFFLSLGTSIAIARVLGPQGKGIYTLAILLPTLITTLINLGIGPATVYHFAQGRYSRREILGSNIFFGFSISCLGLVVGLIIALFFQESLFPGVPTKYLIVALSLVPATLFFKYLQNILLGAQRFKEYNLIEIFRSLLMLLFVLIALVLFKAGVVGAIVASFFSWVTSGLILFFWSEEAAGGIVFKLNRDYLKKASIYGLQVHLANILSFLNYRVDMFLVNGFLNPTAVGFYSVSVALVEKLWLISQAASTVLFPKVAAEEDEQKRKSFTPLVSRTVLWVTALGALILFFLSRWVIEFLYSKTFLPAVSPFRILLPGIVALSVSRVLANDIAGRGKPMLNTYVSIFTLLTNIVLNIIWIPRYGISGAALASTTSYTFTLLARIFFYTRLSGNSWMEVLVPQRMDWVIYRQTGEALIKKARGG